MISPRHLLQLGFIWFCNLNGITTFFISSGRLRQSRVLTCYRIIHNFLVIILTIKFQMDFWHFSAASFDESPLVRLAAITYFGLVFLSLISCMGCAHRRQDRIRNMIIKLQDMEVMTRSRGYRLLKSQKRFLNILLITVTLLLILRLAIHAFLNVSRFLRGNHNPCNCFLSECMIFATNSLAFGLMLEICRNWWRLQSGLEIVIMDPRPFSDQFCRLRKLQCMFQCLINMTEEVCMVFRFVFLCYLLRNVWSGIRVGYMLVRVCLGHSAIESELEYLQMVFIICIQPLLFSLMMNTLTHTIDTILEATKDVIRGLYSRDKLMERSMEWFSLQLAEQHTYVHIFGTYRMNRSLAFDGCSVILLHVIYMVQSEYTSMF
ncbi:putative gustatory receptor 85a [Drosophila eugracilis]|uniref:putative gustatory receptor 85a n=1 Tax=Drosophila eugracilis TaxID=29029 RepID=UPI001BD92CB7|nr:putative gustatory receptor 85a [Drosophila eugracilis]